eukprot:4472758-Prymnesium_polylepis.3
MRGGSPLHEVRARRRESHSWVAEPAMDGIVGCPRGVGARYGRNTHARLVETGCILGYWVVRARGGGDACLVWDAWVMVGAGRRRLQVLPGSGRSTCSQHKRGISLPCLRRPAVVEGMPGARTLSQNRRWDSGRGAAVSESAMLRVAIVWRVPRRVRERVRWWVEARHTCHARALTDLPVCILHLCVCVSRALTWGRVPSWYSGAHLGSVRYANYHTCTA